MVDTNWEDLQQLGQRTYNRDVNGALRVATGIRRDAYGIVRLLYGKHNEPNEVFTQLSALLGSHALLLDGTAGGFISTPDAAALDIIADIDIRVEFVRYDANVVDALTTRGLVAKYQPTGNQRSYLMVHKGFTTVFGVGWSTDGTAELAMDSPALPAGSLNVNFGAARMTLDVVDGANRTARLYSATSLAGPWTEIGTGTTTAGNTSIFAGTGVLVLGSSNSNGNAENWKGRITRAEIRNGIDGTVVANPDFRALAPGTTSFADGTGKTWTLQGTARIV